LTAYQIGYRLRIYAPRSVDTTEATVLVPAAGAPHTDPFKVTTHPNLAGWKPYLLPPRGRRGRLDPLSKHLDTGELAFLIVDQRTTAGGSNLVRWVTAFLGDVNGNPAWMGLRVFVEESLNDGATWSSFWTGSIHTARLNSKLQFELATRDRAQELRYKVFVGRPHLDAAGAISALLPIGITKPYGVQPAVTPLAGTVVQNTTVTFQGLSYQVAGVRLSAASVSRLDNVVSDNMFQLGNGPARITNPSGTLYIPNSIPDDRSRMRGILKRLDTGQQGEFRVGFMNMSPTIRGGRLRSIEAVVLTELRPPAGVATGTPLVNNGGGYVIGTKVIATDGWTISITGIVKAGDLVRFTGHTRHYTVQADANSNGSGQATLSLEPGLTVAVADNEALSVVGEPGFMKMPPNTTSVELTLVGDAPVSKTNPLLINDIHPVQLWKDIYDGHYSRLWRRAEAVPVGQSPGDPVRTVAYDTAKFAILIADLSFPKVRFVITGPESMSAFIESAICQPYQLGYYLDADGKVVPVDLRLPTSLGGILTITDADLVEVPGNAVWEQTRDSAIARADVTYYEDIAIAPADFLASPDFGPSGGPVIANALIAQIEHPLSVLDLGAAQLADTVVAINARGARFMAGDPTIDGLVRARWVEDKLYGFTQHLRQPWGFGGQKAVLQCRRTANTNAKPGDLRLVDVDALPDPATHLRGGVRLMRCLEPSEDGVDINLRFLDVAVNIVASVPSLAQPVQMAGNTRHGASTTVTLNASSEPVEVHYAVTDTATGSAPAEASALWTSAGFLLRMAGDVTVTQIPAGQRVWFRGRTVPASLKQLKLPSAWALAGGTGRVDLATIAAPSAPAGSLQTAKSFRVSWTAGDADLMTEILLATPTTDPRIVIGRALPGSTFFNIPGDIDGTVLVASTTYRVGLRHVALDGSVSAEVTVDIATTGVTTVAPDTGGITVLIGEP